MLTTTLNKDFEREYSQAMELYIVGGGEQSLHRAYELGRKALDEGDAILDVARFHAHILVGILSSLGSEKHRKAISDASEFLSEFFSPFEMTFRGFRETVDNLKIEIAERQKAEEALERSERYYRALIENALDIVTILDENGIVRYESPSCEKVLGYPATELVGRNVFEFVHPDDIDGVLDIFTAGKMNRRATASTEFRYRHKNGEWLILESIGKNLLDDPHVHGIIVNSRDITDRRNLEDIRRKYEFIVNASRESMLLANNAGVCEALNEACCHAIGRDRVEIVGKCIGDIAHGEPLLIDLQRCIDQCVSGSEIRHEGWYESNGMGKLYVEIDCYPYRGVPSAVTHAIVIMRDATKRKNAEHRIQETQRQRAEDLRHYVHLTQEAQEEERQRISRELHDDICQRLTALKLHLNAFEDSIDGRKKTGATRLRTVKKEINSLIAEVRRISQNLRPSTLDHFGLPTALRLLCSEYTKLDRVEVTFKTNIVSPRRYDPETEIALYRIAQEALSNCIRHSGAKKASLEAVEEDGQLVLTITDKGEGFDYQEYLKGAASGKHFGLINMRERIELRGGVFTIESSRGRGTIIKATIRT